MSPVSPQKRNWDVPPGRPRRRQSPFERVLRRVLAGVTAVFRLIVPMSLLMVLLGTIYLYADVPWLPPFLSSDLTGFFTAGDAIIPLPAFSIQLTGRRYGPSYATAQLLVALGLLLAISIANPPQIHQWLTDLPLGDMRTVAAFAGHETAWASSASARSGTCG